MIKNKVQKAAYELVQADARFLYTLTRISSETDSIDSNYIMMCQPYVGIFVDGAEQWGKKVGLNIPSFNEDERVYYEALRQGHKLLEKSYNEYANLIMNTLVESDRYFYTSSVVRGNILEYNNVGTDICNGHYCGNTLVCAINMPMSFSNLQEAGKTIQKMSVIAGKLSALYGATLFPPYQLDYHGNCVYYRDYHFFRNCPFKEQTELGVVLFSILCSINYVTIFIESLFTEDIPQKFKYAYLLYYYLCDFVKDMNQVKGTQIVLDNSMKHRGFRNCLAHYGLGQFMEEKDILQKDVLKGLTIKAFGLDYYEAKQRLFIYLGSLRQQIQNVISVTPVSSSRECNI